MGIWVVEFLSPGGGSGQDGSRTRAKPRRTQIVAYIFMYSEKPKKDKIKIKV